MPGRRRLSGIHKQPVPVIEVRAPGPKRGGLGSGVIGDHIGSRKHHGGDGQAVYAFAAEELDLWSTEVGRPLPDGWFGENLTTVGLDVDAALAGEHWRVGEVLLQVTGPRIPCQTFAGHMGERGWVRRFTERGRTGAYLAVLEPGRIEPGAPVVVEHRPDHAFTVPMLFRALTGDDDLARAALDAGVVRPEERAKLERRVRSAARPG